MKNLQTFQEFVNESVNEGLSRSMEITPIAGVKSGEKIWRLMDRYNPQLGTYYVFSQVKITRSSAKSISCDDNAVYSRENGKRQGKSAAGYGSADYMIMGPEDAKRINDELASSGARVRGFE